DDLIGVLRDVEEELRLEQAVYGMDSLDELALHKLLAAGLSKKHEVAREVHYPSSVGKKQPSRQRCDLVLTERGHPLRLDTKPPSLFDPPEMHGPGAGLWLEVKVAAQFAEGGRPHRGYGAQWRQGVTKDLQKMEQESALREAALVLIVFTANADVLDADLQLFEDHLAKTEVLAGFRQVRSCEIVERNGHRLATVALWPTLQRAD
ncbi:MAG: hypothetical protein AAF656_06110, partial [Planctomycetota bacterium]